MPGRKGGSRAIFVWFLQHPAQNALPNPILQILPSWLEPKSSDPLFTSLFLSFSADVKIDQKGLC